MLLKIFLCVVLMTPVLSAKTGFTPTLSEEPCTLAAPASLSANWSGNQIRVSWNAVANADGYYIRIENKDTHSIIIEDITGGQFTNYQTTGVDNSANYRISVRSMCGSNSSDNVIIIDVTGV